MRCLNPFQKVVFPKSSPHPTPRAKVVAAGPADAREAFIEARDEQAVRYFFELYGMLELMKRSEFTATEPIEPGSFE